MKSLLFIALFLLISCESTESKDIVAFYKCLLLDSDTVYNHINSLVEAIRTLDPAKLSESFSTIYDAIGMEVTRCELEVKLNKNNINLRSTSEVENTNEGGSTMKALFSALLKAFLSYVNPTLKTLGIDIKNICQKEFTGVFLCDLLE